MNLEKMSLDELKDYAKTLGIKVGNIGKSKLIEKINAIEMSSDNVINTDTVDVDSNVASDIAENPELEQSQDSLISIITDDEDSTEQKPEPPVITPTKESVVESITSVIDDLDDYMTDDTVDYSVINLPVDTIVETKSITFGGLTYKSRSNNALFRWDHLGATQPMTIGELNEMNNHKRDFLNKPLIILKDERAMKKFRLTSLYENIAKISNLKSIFSSGDMITIGKTIDTAVDVNMRDLLISKCSQMIKSKTLVDINVIHLLSDKLNYDFEDILTQ